MDLVRTDTEYTWHFNNNMDLNEETHWGVLFTALYPPQTHSLLALKNAEDTEYGRIPNPASFGKLTNFPELFLHT